MSHGLDARRVCFRERERATIGPPVDLHISHISVSDLGSRDIQIRYQLTRPPQAPSATRDDDPLAYCPGTIGCAPHPPPNAGGTCTLAPYAQTPPRFVHIIFTHHTPGFELLCASREGISIVRKLYGCMYVYTGELQARRDETGEKGRRIKCYSDPVNEREGQTRAREIQRR